MKLCECGCGQPAPLAKRSNPGTGAVKGQPSRFIRGHNAKSTCWPGETPQAKGARKRRVLSATAGERFGRGIVAETEVMIPRKGRPPGSASRGARLICDCGNEYVSALQALTNGSSQSCGCLRLERQTGRPVGAVNKMGAHSRPIKNLAQLADPPACKCGCGEATVWNGGKARWHVYVAGHYRQAALYKQEDWLREEYLVKCHTVAEIATECGIGPNAIQHYMEKFGIPRRDRSECHMGRNVGELNPAWKGGVAEWEYSPDWKALARKIRTRDKYTCQDCGEQRNHWGKHLHVHHIDGDKTNNDRANLISLCNRCHHVRHRLMVKGGAAVA